MEIMEWVRLFVGAVFLLIGMFVFLVEMIGVYKFKYVLNRMHAAAMGDTLGLGSCFVGLMIFNGFSFTTLKLFLVIVFLWFTSPVSSHLIARLEVTTDETPEEHYGKQELSEEEEKGGQG